ncbi:4-hydroxy-tetrahydrodipicolinate synthase [Buchnera aphidicola (Eriosoma grossulariae)]|uniref:4-hydroxy-tetrahydrodipicolinate synthase n=1 Tax=Buchnera aphidicola TaxID=9 RepID=UPI003464D956
MFTGSMVALITPMNEKGQICKSSLKKLINYHIKNGTSAIISVGTTGESATLNQHEHQYVIMLTLEIADGKIPIIAGTGANATTESILLTKKFENTGIIGCLTVTPYYNRPTQEGLYQHFKAISENTSLPQILYNVPSRTGCDLLPKTVIKLSKLKNIIGIKEATGDLSRVNQIKLKVNKNFVLISGDDATALDFINLGGKGVISVTANIAAKEMQDMCQLALNGNFTEAQKINQKLMPLHQHLFIESNPIPVKWIAKKLNLIQYNSLRLPMTPVSYSNRKKLEKIFKKSIIYKQ